MIYVDQRWGGEHGIGRFARQVLAAIEGCPLALNGCPTAAFDAARLTLALRALRSCDLFFSPGFSAPLACRAPFVFTVHDLNHLDRPENRSLSKRLYYATVLRPACWRAAQVLTVSEFSRQRILAWSGLAADKVVNVGNGVGAEFSPVGRRAELGGAYLLVPTNRKRHKNDWRLLQAFAQAELRGVQLVFTGASTAELDEAIRSNGLGDRVRFCGTVRAARMPELYRGALATVFVSLYEGFGLPVIESMACGTPVVTSTAAALPEVCGAAAILVEPTSVAQIAAALRQIVVDEAGRRRLTQAGLARAAQYRWSAVIARVRQALRAAQVEGGCQK